MVVAQRREEDQYIYELYDQRRKGILDYMTKRKVKEDWFDEVRQKLLSIEISPDM